MSCAQAQDVPEVSVVGSGEAMEPLPLPSFRRCSSQRGNVHQADLDERLLPLVRGSADLPASWGETEREREREKRKEKKGIKKERNQER